MVKTTGAAQQEVLGNPWGLEPQAQALHAHCKDLPGRGSTGFTPVMVSVTVLDVDRHDLSGLAAGPSAGGITTAAACSGAARMPALASSQYKLDKKG
jgi:hypothetical protein